jgi:penicillin-binding protein 1C
MNLKSLGEARGFFTQLNKVISRIAVLIKKLLNRETQILLRVSLGTAFFIILIWLVLRFSPYPELQAFISRPESTRYYDRNGLLLQITPLTDGLRREIRQEIPQYVKDVFIFAEDRRFYRHAGIDLLSLTRALFQNIRGGRNISGASTITMQLSRLISSNSNNERRQVLIRKIGEAVNALRLEARFSKEEILLLYLNSLPFGLNTEGVASAALTFFSCDLHMLSPSQIFCLAVIPRRPSLYNPLENPDSCITAASELQTRFANDKKLKTIWPLLVQISEDDWKFTSSSVLRFEYPFELPHLIRYIEAHETEKHSTETVYLSIDLALQHYLENIIAGNVLQNYSSRITNGAAIVIDNDTGEILAWVGSTDFFNSNDAGQIDGVLALNQPGSSMKPFLYAMALEKGFKPTDVLADINMSFGEKEIYIPRNFNDRFNGPMLFRAALASSLNIPAVNLLYRLGVSNYSEQLFSLKFDSLEYSAEDAGLGLALGNAPVSLLELTRAFSVFPRDGIFLPLTWKLNSTDSLSVNGTPKSEETERRVFSIDTSRIICSFLSDSNARVLAFGRSRNFQTSFPAIFKTGTANQYQSIVALGATRKYSVGVWMGNFSGETVVGRTGSSIPAAIVRDALAFLEKQNTAIDRDFPPPVNWKLKQVCAVSGMPPSAACLSVVNEYALNGDDDGSCTWHQIVNNRSETIFPAEYQAWFASAQRQGSVDNASTPLEITSPRNGFVYLSGPGLGTDDIPVEVIGGSENVLRVTHNGKVFYAQRPFVFFLPRESGINTMLVQNADEEEQVFFTVE